MEGHTEDSQCFLSFYSHGLKEQREEFVPLGWRAWKQNAFRDDLQSRCCFRISPGKQHFPKEYVNQGRDLDGKPSSVVFCLLYPRMSLQLSRDRVGGRCKMEPHGEASIVNKRSAAPSPWQQTYLFLWVSLVSPKARGLWLRNPFLSSTSPFNRICLLGQKVWGHFLQIPSSSATSLLLLLDKQVICFPCVEPCSCLLWVTYLWSVSM